MWEFKELLNSKYGLSLESYNDLYKWSIENISRFWEETWHFTGVVASKPFDKVIDSSSPFLHLRLGGGVHVTSLLAVPS